MKTIKIIELLNKIANGEDVPKKIKTNGYIYEYQGDDYLYTDKNDDNHEYWLFSEGYADKFVWLDNFLNTEVEILEEKEYMNILKINTDYFYTLGIKERDGLLKEKINEIIDYINKENK